MPPLLTAKQLLPPCTVFATCYDPDALRLICPTEWQVEAASGVALAILGDMPAFCHANTMTAPARALFARAGVTIGSSILPFHSEAEAVDIARYFAKADIRFNCSFPLSEPVRQAGPLVVDHALHCWLNNKENLAQLCESKWVPPRTILPLTAVSDFRDAPPDRPVYVKGARNTPSGGGLDVRYCPDAGSWSSVLDWIETTANLCTACIVEEAIPFSHSWCLNYVVMDGAIRYLGAAEQLFASPGSQRGSLVDDSHQPLDEAVQVGHRISAQAQHLGYRGFAGYDMCMTKDGRIYFFDLNFRVNLSTNLRLLHRSGGEGPGSSISVACNQTTAAPLAAVVASLEDLTARGAFIPTRLYDGSKHEAGPAPSIVTGLLTARSPAAVADLEKEFAARLAEPR